MYGCCSASFSAATDEPMNCNRIILSLAFLLVAHLLAAQVHSSVKVKADKNKIVIGEPLQLTIEVTGQPGSAFTFPAIDSMEHFELLDKTAIDSSGEGNVLKAVYKITSFDSGHWVIPSFVPVPGTQSDTIGIDVVFSDFNPGQEYHDIKDVLDVKLPGKEKQWWWYAAGGVLLLALLARLLLRKKQAPVKAPVLQQTINPYEEAMGQLQDLQQNNPAAKEYYSALTDIFRVYIFRRKNILSLPKTTGDLVIQLKSLGMDKQQFDKLSQVLRMSDFVKFAKYIPGKEDDKNAFDEIKKAIITIEKSGAALHSRQED